VKRILSIRKVSKRFGAAPALADVSLDIADGEFLTILGESGSGKTTLLRIIAGFERPDDGEIWMQDERLDLLPPNRRNINTVFQHYALFPHLSVFENVAYGLRARGVREAELRPRVQSALSEMRMLDFARRRPTQLSGGQQQRVALARALVNRPRLLLLDEPLSALDAALRRAMQTELKALQRDVGITFIFVTHDQEEAMTLSDRIALLHNGRVEQVDTPRCIYQSPQTAYAAAFIGQTNLVAARIQEGFAAAGPLRWPCALAEGNARFSLRPEHVRLVNGGQGTIAPDMIRLPATIRRQTFQGATELLDLDCGDGLALTARVGSTREQVADVTVEINPSHLIPVRG